MADQESSKILSLPTKAPNLTALSDTKKTMAFAYGFMLTFICCTLLFLFNPSTYPSSSSSSSPWLFESFVTLKNPSFLSSNESHFSSLFSHIFPNSTSSVRSSNSNLTTHLPISNDSHSVPINNVTSVVLSATNLTNNNGNLTKFGNVPNSRKPISSPVNQTHNSHKVMVNDTMKYLPSELYESMLQCDLYDGKWVIDDSYPLYEHGSCPYIDEPFNCFLNGRPDHAFEKYRWQPNGCNIPRLNGTHMLELLRGKRLVFVGDSLNRNMWESLVCILRNSVKEKSSVVEASGRQEFRTEGSYSFIIKDYNCSVEFFRSPFLVQEWKVSDNYGSKQTLRLDLVERSSDRYKDADILIFNTGHWWTHEKTSKGRGYYQEGGHVYGELDGVEAFRRAVTTWARWVDANVDPKKTQVFFRGYSSSHFRGGSWNSGGECDKETKPFKNETHLLSYPPIMQTLENVIKWMKTPIFYLNITRLTDYRKDAHPAVYRSQHLTEEERHSPLRYQDCSHWCLPGVPDTWNELIYAQMLIRHYQKQLHGQQHQEHHHKRS